MTRLTDPRDGPKGLPFSACANGALDEWGSLSLNPPARLGECGTWERFELIRCLGAGGMGIVFLARDPSRSEPVAIKLLRPDLARHPRARALLVKESGHMQALQHPHILPVLDYGETPENAWLIMPFVEGGNLNELVARQGPLKGTALLLLARQIASALLFAHQRGIIHRDLKPANILVGPGPRLWVADFGLARSLLNDVILDPRSLQKEGTPYYLSPLHAQGIVEDTRTDVYSFGAVLYEMLTGVRPYHDIPQEQVTGHILAGPPNPIGKLNPQAPSEWVTVAEGAMARELRERYAHMSCVMEDLERIRATQTPRGPGGSAAAQPLQSASPARRSSVRPSLILAAAAAALFLLVIAINKSESLGRSGPDEAAQGLLRAHRIELPGVFNWSQGRVADFNADGADDLFLTLGNRLLVVSRQGRMLGDWRLPAPENSDCSILLRGDLDQDGQLDTLVSWSDRNRMILAGFNDFGREIRRFTLPRTKVDTPVGQIFETSITQCRLADLNNNGRPELILWIFTGHGREPRAILALDPVTSQELWQFDTAAASTSLHIADLNGDGFMEVVCGTDAVANGAVGADGTDDRHSYVFALDHGGQLLWRREIGGLHIITRLIVDDIDGQGQPGLLAWTECHHDHRAKAGLPENGEILRLDGAGDIIARYETGVRLFSCIAADLNGDGPREILATDRLGRVHRLAHDLTRPQCLPVIGQLYESVVFKFCAAADLDQDGHPELVATAMQRDSIDNSNPGRPDLPPSKLAFHDARLLLLSSDLHLLASQPLFDFWETHPTLTVTLAQTRARAGPEIVVLMDRAEIFEWRPPAGPPDSFSAMLR